MHFLGLRQAWSLKFPDELTSTYFFDAYPQRQRLHPEFLANETDYLRMRDSLLSQYRGQWVAVQGAQVIAASKSLQAVTQKAAAAGGHPYIAFVGGEDNVVFRVRHAEFVFDGPAEKTVIDP